MKSALQNRIITSRAISWETGIFPVQPVSVRTVCRSLQQRSLSARRPLLRVWQCSRERETGRMTKLDAGRHNVVFWMSLGFTYSILMALYMSESSEETVHPFKVTKCLKFLSFCLHTTLFKYNKYLFLFFLYFMVLQF